MPLASHPPTRRRRIRPTAAELSINANGNDPHAGEEVDRIWREHVNDALAVLHTAREPDEAMAAVGDVGMWRNMVEAAIAQKVD